MNPVLGPFIAEKVGPAGWSFILFHTAFVPWSTYRSRGKVGAMKTLPPLAGYLQSVLISQLVLMALALLIARLCGIGLFPRIWPRPLHALVGLAVCAALVAFMFPRWKRAVEKGSRRLYFFMPRSGREKAIWVMVAAAAGVGEEIAYRGVLYALLLRLTGTWWIAALLAAVVFGAAHAFQSGRSMVIIFGFSLVFQALMLWSGALYVSMLAHFLYDVVAGLNYSRLGRQMGFRAEGAPGAENPPVAEATSG